MSKHFVHYTEGRVCAREVSFDYDGDKISNVHFVAGCPGNTQGVARLAEGRTPEELIGLLKGIKCKGDNSCPNELAMGIEEMLEELEL